MQTPHPRCAPLAWSLLLCLVPAVCLANGGSGDIELLRPVFSPGALPSLATATPGEKGAVRYGAVLGYTNNPVVLYEWGTEQGAIVADRMTLTSGFSADITDRHSVDMTLPMAVQWGSEIPEFAADGFALGDAIFALNSVLVDGDVLRLGSRAELGLPVGTRKAWMGEQDPRLGLSALVVVDAGRIELLGRAGIVSRPQREGPEDYTTGLEVMVDPAIRVKLSEQLVLFAHTAGRLSPTETAGVLPAIEGMAGLQVRAADSTWLDIGFGRGLTRGYGTTDTRVHLAVRMTGAPPPAAAPEEAPVLDDRVVVQVPSAPEPPAPLPPEPIDPTLSVQEALVELANRIQFEKGSYRLKPESDAVLRQVATRLADHPELLHIVVEGHASPEASEAYNWRLSQERGRVVYDELMNLGVHPMRMSYRGLGEYAVEVTGEEEEALSPNRRVIFHIVAQEVEPTVCPEPEQRPSWWEEEDETW